MNPRLVAAHCLLDVVDRGRSLSGALPAALPNVSDVRDRALVQQLCYGVLRRFERLDATATRLLEKPLRKKDRDIHMLLLVGLYQLCYLGTSKHAAVHETVEATRAMGKAWAVKLVNAVLRNYQRNAAQLVTELNKKAETRFSLPSWLLRQFKQDWPQDWESIARESNQHAPMTLRVNRRIQSVEEYQGLLESAGIGSKPLEFAPDGLQLIKPVSVDSLPGFAEGSVSVQDGAAQLAQQLLSVQSGMRVLDACAAPGGKSAHLQEATDNNLDLVAIDIDAQRSARIEENLVRLGLNAHILVADAAQPDHWWDGQPFDRILLDAPCAATGVIRRHPDIKILRRDQDVAVLAQRQAILLDRLWPLLASGGMLLYSTCSVSRQENSDQVQSFLQRASDAAKQEINALWGRGSGVGRQVLPGENDMDGFYYACIVKT